LLDVPVPCQLWRGGTSRAVLFAEEELSDYDLTQRESIVLAALGSPDPAGRQVDGLGGGSSSLSKAAIVRPAVPGEDADVAFEFAQVEVSRAVVDFTGNCGNISAAIGPYAVNLGLLEVSESATDVVCLSLNTGQRFVSRVPVESGRFNPTGDYVISGVPGSGSKIDMAYQSPFGSVNGSVFPTGMTSETVELPSHRKVTVSIVDVANPMVFVTGEDMGIDVGASPEEIELKSDELRELEMIRSEAAVRLGMVNSPAEATTESPTVPKVAVVGRADSFISTEGEAVQSREVDLLVRLISMRRVHRTLAVTAAMSAAAAAQISGTVVGRCVREGTGNIVRLGHPAGVLACDARVERLAEGHWVVPEVSVSRTARLIMNGNVLIPHTCVSGKARSE